MSQTDNDSGLEWFYNRKSARYRLQNFASRVTRGAIPSPFYVSWLTLQRKKDDDVRIKSSVPERERADYFLVSSIEFFAPQDIKNLALFVKSLASAKGAARDTEDLNRNFKNQRGRPGSSLELYLRHASNDHFNYIGQLCKLPKFCSHAQATIQHLTPSLSAITVTFYIDKKIREDINSKLHQTYPVKLELAKNGSIRTLDSRAQQRKIARRFEIRLRNDLNIWFKDSCTGVFSRINEQRPINFLISTGSAKPLAERKCHPILEILNLDHPHLVFSPHKIANEFKPDAISFAFRIFEKENPGTFIFGSHRAFDNIYKNKYYGDDENSAFRYIDDITRRSLSAIWIPNILSAYNSEAVRIRDNISTLTKKRSGKKSLPLLQSGMAHCSEGAMIAREIQEYLELSILCNIQFLAHSNEYGISKKNESIKENRKSLIENLSEHTIISLKELHEIIDSQSNILNAIISIKMQASISILTIITAILGFVSMISGKFLEKFIKVLLL